MFQWCDALKLFLRWQTVFCCGKGILELTCFEVSHRRVHIGLEDMLLLYSDCHVRSCW